MGALRIELASTDYKALDQVCQQIQQIVTKAGAKIRGPVPLPTKILSITTRKSPCGEGGKTWEKWELRIHKRLIDIPNIDERLLRRIMTIAVPENVKINIILP